MAERLSRDEVNAWFTIPGTPAPAIPSDPPVADPTQVAARPYRQMQAEAEAKLHVPSTTPDLQFGSYEPNNSEIGEADGAD